MSLCIWSICRVFAVLKWNQLTNRFFYFLHSCSAKPPDFGFTTTFQGHFG
jgi:hypothetical protein